jgi:ABC-type sugar transport system, periplasmic component
MRSRLRALAVPVLITLMTALLFTGCGESGKQPQKTEGNNNTAGASSTQNTKVDNTPIKLSLWVGESWVQATLNQNGSDPISKKLAEKTGVSFEVQYAKSADYTNELNLMMASGDYPDLIEHNGSFENKLKAAGAIIPLDEYINKYAPNFLKRLEYQIKMWRNTDDGKLYGFRSWNWNIPDYTLSLGGRGVYMRYDILKQLKFKNLDKAENSFITWSEYFDILKQVKEKYPDISPVELDEDKDMVFGIVLSSLGKMSSTPTFCYEDGKMVYGYSSNSAPEVVKFFNDLFTGGYLEKNFAVMKLDQVKTAVANGNCFSYFGDSTNLGDAVSSLYKDNDEKRLVRFMLRKDESITRIFTDSYQITGYGVTNVSTSCKYPERVAQLLDYTASEEGSRLLCTGIEGVNYTKGADGKLVPIKETLDNYAAWNGEFFKKSGVASLMNVLPTLAGVDENGNAADIYAVGVFQSNKWQQYNIKNCNQYQYDGGIVDVGTITSFDPDKQADAQSAYSKIKTYVGDRFTKCVLAGTPQEAQAQYARLLDQMKKDSLDKLNSAVSENFDKRMKFIGVMAQDVFK